MRRLKSTEHDEQVALFKWAAIMQNKYPELALLYANPNAGKRNPVEGRRKKMEGLKAGIPDICLPIPRGKYHGLYIELKIGKNKVTNHQAWWLCELAKQGYAAFVSYGWEQASKDIWDYLHIEYLNLCGASFVPPSNP